MEYKWRLIYKPPINQIDYNNIDTLPKVFHISKQECKEQIDLELKIQELKNLYNMKSEFLILETLELLV